MAAQIFHEGTALRSAATAMGSVIQSMTNIENALVRIHNRVDPSWLGRAASQNTKNFHKLRQMTVSYLSDARHTKTALDEAVSLYDKTEQTQVTKVSQLGTKGIF